MPHPPIKPRYLCLSGGGIRTIAHLGALKVLEEAGLLTDIKEYLGVSAGAFIGFALAIGYSITEMIQIMEGVNFGEIRSVDPEHLLLFDEHFGIDAGEGLIRLFNSILKIKRLPVDLKFSDLKCGLRIYATDLNTQQPREFSARVTPNIKITDALRASMSFPLYFTPVNDQVTGNMLSDGGIIGNYPMVYLSQFEAQNAIGLTFNDHVAGIKEIQSLQDYFHKLLSCFWIDMNKIIYERFAESTIIIPCSEFPSYHFEATAQEKKALFECGAAAATAFLSSRSPPTTTGRRRSVC